MTSQQNNLSNFPLIIMYERSGKFELISKFNELPNESFRVVQTRATLRDLALLQKGFELGLIVLTK